MTWRHSLLKEGMPDQDEHGARLRQTIPDILEWAAARWGTAPFIVADDMRASFGETLEEARRVAASLIARDIGHGDRVAIWAPNSGRWIVAALAAQMIGAAIVPINTRYKGAEAAYILAKTRARALFTVSGFLGNDYVGMLRRELDRPDAPVRLAELSAIVLLDDAADGGACGWKDFLARSAPAGAVQARRAGVNSATIADILFTSGTTGEPKGAMHGHGQMLWMASAWNEANDLRAGDRHLIVNPFFHSFGYRSGWMSALLAGITVYPVAAFDAAATLAAIERERISVLMGPPTLFRSLIDAPERASFDLSSLRVGHTGSSNVPEELVRAGREELGFDLFLTSYGLTEATALVSVNRADASFETIARTVGRPLPGTQVRIAGPAGGDAAAGEAGELLVRGPNVMKGYFEDGEATAQTIDAGGWLHTGDVARLLPDGNLTIVDRLKDVVIVGGFNAYPAEIEKALRAHPAIAEVCVIGLPDSRMGEVVAACVVPRGGMAITLDELTAWSRERLANFKVPRHLFLLDEIPRTALGKPQKFLLRQRVMAASAAGQPASLLRDPSAP